MYTLILVIHVMVSLVLVLVILLQTGRGGMAEAMGGAAAQSLFGGGVSNVLTRVTAGCASLFVVTCLSLAYLSTMRGRSILEQVPMASPESLPAGLLPPPSAPTPAAESPAQPAAPAPELPAPAGAPGGPGTSSTPPVSQ